MAMYCECSGVMPKPMRSRPRAPIDAKGRTVAGGSGSRPRLVRIALTAAARSGAVSAKVPSKSNSTARLVTHAAQEVIDVAVALEPVTLPERVVGHAGHDVELPGVALGVVLGACAFVSHRRLALQQVELGNAQRFFREVDARDPGPAVRHRLGEDAAAAAHVEHALAAEARAAVDPVEAQRVDVVQGAELAVRVPPAVRELAEFLQLCRVGVHRNHCPKKKPRRSGALFAARECYLFVEPDSLGDEPPAADDEPLEAVDSRLPRSSASTRRSGCRQAMSLAFLLFSGPIFSHWLPVRGSLLPRPSTCRRLESTPFCAR